MASLDYHRETDEERNYREQYLEKVLLKDYRRYREALQDFRLNFVDDPSITAAIDTTNYYILINEDEKFANPDRMSMLIRHELLHQILDHVKREIIEVAKRKGIDPNAITKVQFEDIMNAMNRTTDFNLRNLNTRNFGNRAGDTDLSRYYKLVDKEIVREMGGLLLDDHPEWSKLYFEQILQKCRQEDFELRQRVFNRRLGDVVRDENGKVIGFNKTGEVMSRFRDDTVIDTRDVLSVKIPTVEDIKLIAKFISIDYCWLFEASDDPDMHKGYIWGDIRDWDVMRELYVYPVLTIKNSDLYINIFNDNINKNCNCGGYRFRVIPGTNKIITESYIGSAKLNDLGQSNEYSDSIVKTEVDKWWANRKIK